MLSDRNERVVRLEALLAGDADSVGTTCKYLKKDGFIFLDMRDSSLLNEALPPFQWAREYLQGDARGKGSRTDLHGHISSKYKDSFRFLSGNQYETSISHVDGMDKLVQAMDETAIKIAEVLAKPLFQMEDTKQVGYCFDLPLLDPQPRNQQAYGLIDIVSYHNDSPFTPEIVVSAHQDPGLFVLALPEMAPGLELLSVSGEWVAPPSGMGVIWTGRAASACLIPCVHRVRRHETARLACWHEICTAGQISAPLLQHLEQTDQQLTLGNGLVGTDAVLDYLRRAEDHEQDNEIGPPGDGLPVSKSTPSQQTKRDKPTFSSARQEAVDGAAGISLPDIVELPGNGLPMAKNSGMVLPLRQIPPLRAKKTAEKKMKKRSPQNFLRVQPAPDSVPSGLSSMKVETASVYFPVRKEHDGWYQPWKWW